MAVRGRAPAVPHSPVNHQELHHRGIKKQLDAWRVFSLLRERAVRSGTHWRGIVNCDVDDMQYRAVGTGMLCLA